jgi:hypothetical protein
MTATATESLIVYLLLFIGVAATLIGSVLARRIALRPIDGYSAMPLSVGEAVESDRAVHVSLGSSAIREESTLTALASAEVLYHIAERSAVGDRPTFVTLSDPVTLGIAQDTLRRAYKARARLDRYRPSLARWYPQGPRSFAFAAGAGLSAVDEKASVHIVIGRFGAEMALLTENVIRTDGTLITHSDRIEGQAVAYALSDTPLIGEELFAGGAYLGRTPLLIGGVAALDVLRYLTLAALIAAAIVSFLRAGH